MKTKTIKKPVRLRQLDFECEIGERVFWTNLQKERFEGIILAIDEYSVALLQMDNGEKVMVQC